MITVIGVLGGLGLIFGLLLGYAGVRFKNEKDQKIAQVDTMLPQLQCGKYGEETPETLAEINELICIGCNLCVQVCPVDAILGAPKYIHTVIAQECTGCELCVAYCPVNCIEMTLIPLTVSIWKWPCPAIVELRTS